MPEKKRKLSLKNLAMLPSFFLLFFCVPKTKSTSQARIKPEILSAFGSNPTQKAQLDLQLWQVLF